jgi:hypothetical protein
MNMGGMGGMGGLKVAQLLLALTVLLQKAKPKAR